LATFDRSDVAGTRRRLELFLERYRGDPRNAGVREALAELARYEGRPRKSPPLAATMSAIIPGTGQMYAERYRDGLVALAVNGLFIAGTVASFKDENYALAAIVGGVGLPFYVGNIYGAANATRQWNLAFDRTTRDALVIALEYHF
jgi:TM2 domain-containing membrane protein YozV